MSNHSVATYITQLPVHMSKAKELQWSVEYWQQMYSEAGSQKESAWLMYGEAIDNQYPRAMILDLLATAQLFDDICRDTWEAWQESKRELLALSN